MQLKNVYSREVEGRSLNTTGSPSEALIDDFGMKSEHFKNLGALVRLERGYTHLRHNFEDTVVDGGAVLVHEILEGLNVLGPLKTLETLSGRKR